MAFYTPAAGKEKADKEKAPETGSGAFLILKVLRQL